MNTLQNRIDSFNNKAAEWLYTNNSKYCKTESFAKAGFYFVGRKIAPDCVRCFLCDIELSNWQPNQSPFFRHANESPRCAWKRLNFPDARKRPLSDHTKAFDTPRSIRMHTTRLATFNCNKYWPPKKGTEKYPTTTKLASAGFYFSPSANFLSRVKCAYCDTTMTVNPNDKNFLTKHKNLSTDCAFFENGYNTRSSRSTRLSSAKGDKSDTDSSTRKRPINKVLTSSETSAPISKRPKEQSLQSTLSPMYCPAITAMHINNYSRELASSIYYTSSPPPLLPSSPPPYCPVSYGIVQTVEDFSQPGLFSHPLPQNQKMTVEEHWNYFVKTSSNRLQEIHDLEIKKFEEKFNFPRTR